MKKIIMLLLLMLSFLTGCGKKEVKEINVSAAASLKNCLEEITKDFEHENKNIKVNLNFGGSGALKNQIIAGAPVDLVFFASQSDLKDLDKKGLIDEKYQSDLLKNRLVIAGRREISSLNDIIGDKVAIGFPDTVPAGRYTKQAFTNAQIWDKVQPDLVFAKDVRSAAQYVDLDEVDYASIYKTDAKVLKNTKIVYVIPEELHKPIIYSYGVIKNKNTNESIKFYDFLQSQKAKKIYKKYNFELVDEN